MSLVAASLALYAPALGIGLLADDYVLIVRARAGDFWEPQAGGFLRPVPLLLWAVIDRLAGSAPALGIHGVNVVLHGLNSYLTLLVARRIGAVEASARLAAVFFLTFPAAPEAVAWGAGVHDVLVTTLALAFVLTGTSASIGPPGLVMSAALTLAAIGVKETALVLPVLCVLAGTSSRGPRSVSRLWYVAVSGAIAAGYAAWRLLAVGVPDDYPVHPSRFLLKELLVRPFAALGAPWSAELLERYPVIGFAAVAGIAALVALGTRGWRDDFSALTRCLRLAAWIPLSILPVYSLFYVAPDLQGSRYLYLASAGWSILLAELAVDGVGRWPRVRPVRPVLWLLLVTSAAAGTRFHLGPWRDAAGLRDRVLAAASVALIEERCERSSQIEGLPDSVRGAYVFRSGFREALREHGIGAWSDAAPRGTNDRPCRLRWNGHDFAPASSSPPGADM